MYGIEIVYIGRDNTIDIELRENGVNLPDYSPITRVVVTFNANNKIDSDLTPQYLDWSSNKLIIKAGLAGIAADRYKIRIETFDPNNPNGVVWTDSLRCEVRA
jgi:hypothetical protein